MGSDEKNLMSDGNVQIVKTGEVVGAAQLTDGELIIEAGGRAENTIVTGAGWLKVEAGGIARGAQYGNNGTLSVSDGAIATDIVQSDGGAISLSTLATVNGRHPEGEFSVDQGYACGLLLENGGNLRVLEGHRAEKIILDQAGGLLVNGTTSSAIVDEGGELLVYPGGEASNSMINQGGVFMLAGKASDTTLVGGAMNNLGGEDIHTLVENSAVYRLGTDGLQLYSSGKAKDLAVNTGGRAEIHAGTVENVVVKGGTMIVMSPTSADDKFVVEEDCAPVELMGNVAVQESSSLIIGYGADLQQSTVTVQQGGVLILDGSTVKGDSVTFRIGELKLDGGKVWLITAAATHVQLKAKSLRGEGTICLQTSAKEISPDSISVKGEVSGDIHVEITDASRQPVCSALKLQPDEDGIGATLRPA
ncbi:AIDA repeat-containing protein [Escherichia marmotae]|uniref:AIDA repeat-containing protein n=1 Tax=Escherichia marmotae TaxID=1499973 RepID=UPI002812D5BE|nr:AIDA repeat-containing protein [Escherichia marmotae]MDQ9240393.1 AIDA repeat-containing protein [Escherichia marmotae]MDQ9274101.1 AIDA repeat-containing protein [Escherichia marmotae]